MSSEITSKKRRRTILVNSIKKVITRGSETLDHPVTVDDDFLTDLEGYVETLVEKFQNVKVLNEEISNLLLENEEEAELNEQHETEFTLYFKKNLTRFNKFIRKYKVVKP